jgi:hypothetical protein
VTTREKILSLVGEFQAMPKSELAPELRGVVEAVKIARGFGVDVIGWVVPETDAEADVLVDKLIALCLMVRGDDLPPFDPDRYGEGMLVEGEDEAA